MKAMVPCTTFGLLAALFPLGCGRYDIVPQHQGPQGVTIVQSPGGSTLAFILEAVVPSFDPARIATFVWDFGDGSTDQPSKQRVSHAYKNKGIYPVTVKVVDDDGGVGQGSLILAVPGDNRPPIAKIVVQPTEVRKGQEIAFIGTDSSDPDKDDGIALYTWNFGDSSPKKEGPTATHSYGSADTYTATLNVQDTFGYVGFASIDITVKP